MSEKSDLTFPDISPEDSLIEYPSDFPIKVMALSGDAVLDELLGLVQSHDEGFIRETVEIRPSSKGTYVGYTFTIKATSREQLDNLYRALHSHEKVKMVL
ncbi:YbeD family protein [Taylorella equigenitalis]|uniref:YbeD family protein n=1 Tax=Taylorella equigenitalis TaxID=29575 RepID=UPI0003F68A18|nr:DUF493 family protein [Taylorella equigenitalis]ASY29860.1 DUF493 domain-containing protein [Taylorella equigenitalis]ASY40154.1 DUF493 domain-containing protein [Taylorella equigenitalis]KOS58908.1 hypothetical protein AM589_03090 [Taylorella equigenitalis]WDU46454.1 DUF493 family protein [Taylorella equigenitalis]WDU47936.1 DUF493 family protein [Taylorella equigenitalis]